MHGEGIEGRDNTEMSEKVEETDGEVPRRDRARES